MLFTVSMVTAFVVCLSGILVRFWQWFRIQVGPEGKEIATTDRIAEAARRTVKVLLTRRVLRLPYVVFIEVLLQLHILKQSFGRWCMHMALFYGFGLLILMHALADLLVRPIFPGYESTLNPFFFLRNFFGLWVLFGAAVAFIRRVYLRRKWLFTGFADRVMLGLIVGILLSGFFLEAVQIVSEPIFDEMVVEYMDEEDPEILDPLRAYWAAEYGVVFSKATGTRKGFGYGTGEEIHGEYCAYCHSHPSSAFVSYAAAKRMGPVASYFNRVRADQILWAGHFLLVFLAMALLPFSKFFHLISTPLSLVAKRLGETSMLPPAGRLNRRALSLDACTHCGVCNLSCSVAPVYRLIKNATILPSEKLSAIRKNLKGAAPSGEQMAILSEGSFICTECRRCTDICPSGIDLKDLWQASRQDLKRAGFPEPHLWIMKRTTAEWADKNEPAHPAYGSVFDKSAGPLNLTGRPESFASCVQCTTCTTVCPVVATVDDPAKELDLTPQQVMNLLRLEMRQTAMGARMVWKCVTCYMCQEHCPQGVKVADVMYELRNLASDRFRPAAAQPSTADEVMRPKEKGRRKKR